MLFSTQDESQWIAQLDEYNTGFENIDMEQFRDGLIISEDDSLVPPLITCHAASWVKKSGVNTQQLENMIDSQRKSMRNAYMTEVEFNHLDIE